MLKDYYSILGISFNASDDEIKRAYRALSKRWHPDVNPGLDTTAIMQDINEAYFILRDSAMRVRYDAEYVKKTAGYDMQDVVLRQAPENRLPAMSAGLLPTGFVRFRPG